MLSHHRSLMVRQIRELVELFGFETRNKYEILDLNKTVVAYAAEQQKGIFGWIMRQYFGHWRKYDVMFFDPARAPYFRAHHPFRWFFHRFEIFNGETMVGAIQQRFSIFTKRFDIQNRQRMTIMEVSSPIWKLWTFNFVFNGKAIASVKKKWSGLFTEAFTDKDTFMVEFTDESLSEDERKLVLAAAVFIDMKYFETKAD